MASFKELFGGVRARKAQMSLAVRGTVAATLAFAIATAFQLKLPLWAVLTSLIVTQGSVGRSLKATRDYMFGTIGGAIYGGAITVLIPHSGELQLLGMLILAVTPLAFIAAINPSLNAATVTAVIVLLVPTMGHLDPLGSAIDRVFEVAVGALTGLAVSFIVLPSRAHVQMRSAAGRLLELIAAAMTELLAGLSRGRDNDALHQIQDGIGTALTELNATGAEAERERSARLSSGADTGPLLRTILRLRHDVVMIGRASVVPLPSELQARLSGPVTRVSDAIATYLRGCAAAIRNGSGPPAIWPIHVAVKAYAEAVAAVRSEGLTRGLPGDAAERFFALGFSLDQMRQNLIDLERVIAEWAGTAPGKPHRPEPEESPDTAGA
ncbi:FUSC family protein [Bradyrhizobium sp. HKCCYLS2038]|uniref:FUSC family protein n=1 Tax=unclassified Bradyrhizobium TaxID=2631580 RepID=UPI003EBAEFA9